MSLKPEIIDAMVAAGCSAEQIAAVVKASMAGKSTNAERQRRYRERHRNVSNVTERNGDVTNATEPSPSLPKRKVSPCTPSKENNPLSPTFSEPNGSSNKRSVATSAAEFADEFWPAYPNKVGKPDALKKFEIARRSASLEEIMAGLARYVATKPPDRNWCNPATWLHQSRWTDEPAPQPILRVAASNPAPKPRRFGDEFADFLRGETPLQQRDERTIDGTVQRR